MRLVHILGKLKELNHEVLVNGAWLLLSDGIMPLFAARTTDKPMRSSAGNCAPQPLHSRRFQSQNQRFINGASLPIL
jgi:hypothetical protein